MGRNLASLLTDTAARHGDRTAIKLDDARRSATHCWTRAPRV